MKKYIAEFAGTFLLVLFGTGSIVLNQSGFSFFTHAVISAVFGISVFLMIILFGKLSGAHINPAVTICLAIDKKFRWREVIPYCIFQLVGALCASFLLHLIFPQNELLGATRPAGASSLAFFIEILLMFILMLMILNAAPNLIISAAVIGTVVGFEAFFAGPFTGASMNPARSIGPAIVSGHLKDLWLYILAPLFGGTLAIFINRSMQKNESN